MVRLMLAGDVEHTNRPLLRELEAAVTMKELLNLFPTEPELAIAIALTRKGDRRILRTEDAVFLAEMVAKIGIDVAWPIAISSGLFLHIEPTCNSKPNVRPKCHVR